MQEERDLALAAKEREERAWHQEFWKTVQESETNKVKKQQIFEQQYAEVIDDEGNYLPVWYAKELAIKEDPSLYQHYLDWLTNFDIETRTFKNIDRVDKQTEVTRTIMSLVEKKQSKPKTNSQRRPKKKDDDTGYVANPLDY
jgi:hypothetical protein